MILTIKSLGMLPKKSEILNVDDKDTSYESDDSVQVVDFLQSHLPNFIYDPSFTPNLICV